MDYLIPAEMIHYLTRKYSWSDVKARLDEDVAEWFSKFKKLTPPQEYGIVPISEGRNVLICAPTGSGKTLTAFLSILSKLFSLAKAGKLENRVYCIYISPLRALNNDIYKNLLVPVKEINDMCEEKYGKRFDIRIYVRTGDSSQSAKARMLRIPPHILITTPETFGIVITAPKFKELLRRTKWVIVDEIHSICENKRGVHLAVSLERLQEMCEEEFVRIGLSATINPLDDVAKFLVGFRDDGESRDCYVIDARFEKKMSLRLICPVDDLLHSTAEKTSSEMYRILADVISRHNSTLIFTNTRSGTERVVYRLRKLGVFNAEELGAHHSSLSRIERVEVEDKLKSGEMKGVVCIDRNSEVLQEDGKWVRALDLSRNHKVASLNLNSLSLTTSNFQGVLERNNVSPGVLVRTMTGKELRCTLDHKLLTIEDGLLHWVRAGDLKKGDFIATIRHYKIDSQRIPLYAEFLPSDSHVKLNPAFMKELKEKLVDKFGSIRKVADVARVNYSTLRRNLKGDYPISYENLKKIAKLAEIRLDDVLKNIDCIGSKRRLVKLKTKQISGSFVRFLGFFLSDGGYSAGSLRIYGKEPELLSKYASLIKNEFRLNYREHARANGVRIGRFSFKCLLGILRKMGVRHKRKALNNLVPRFVFSLPETYIWEFLSGYFDGDGFLEAKSNGRVYSAGFATFSKEMAEDLHRLLLRVGVVSMIRTINENEEFKRKRKRTICYAVSILGGDHFRKFAKEINPFRKSRWRLKSALNGKGSCNQDIIPNIGGLLRRLRVRSNASTHWLYEVFKLNPVKYELGERNITRKKLSELIEVYGRFNEDPLADYLRKLANSDIFWDKVTEVKAIKLKRPRDLVNVGKFHNYVVEGIITRNSSTSLELGIDIGHIDAVVQIGSPKGVSRGLQRIGRAGHAIGKVSKGIFIGLELDDLVEDAVLIREALKGHLDRVHIPTNCLDVLAQQLVGMAATRKWNIEEAYSLVRRSYPYRNLGREDFMSVLRYLSGVFPNLERYKVYGKIWLDEEEMVFGKRGRLLRPIYFENIGTIPERVSVRVYAGGRYIGRLEEEFVEQLFPGDIFILGGRVYRFRRARGMKAYVEPAEGEKPTVPSWFSELLPLSFDLGEAISKFRYLIWRLLEEGREEEVNRILREECGADRRAVASILNYFKAQRRFLKHLGVSVFHSPRNLLIEQYLDSYNNINYIFHVVFGRRVNNALSRALANLLRKRLGLSIKLMVDDNGFLITIPLRKKIDIREALGKLRKGNVREEIEEAVINSQYVWRTFRHCATRGLMILRRYKGHEVRVSRQQMNAETLFKICSEISGFPLVREAVREIAEDKMDVINAERVLNEIELGERKWIVLPEYDLPSPFAHGLISRGMSDVVLMEDRLKLLRELYESVMRRIRDESC